MLPAMRSPWTGKHGLQQFDLEEMLMDNFVYYAVALLMVIIAIVAIKKMAGCVVRLVVAVVLIAMLAALYYKFFS